MSLSRCAYVPAALAGLVAGGLSLVGMAAAATTVPSAVSSAPSSADAAPAPPSISDVPVPFVFRPVDTSDGLYGVRRGSVPTASAPDLQRVPVARQLPSIAVTPLPANAQSDESATSDTEAEDSAAQAAE
jgi:hypothetical protein